MGTKSGIVFMAVSQFIVGFALAFIQGWQFALVLLCFIPFITGSLFVMVTGKKGDIVACNKAYA